MSTLTNKAQNTGNLSNKDLSQSNLTFEQTDPDTFADMVSEFSTPFGIDNKAVNTANLTNKALNG